jgi:hypothetical protein
MRSGRGKRWLVIILPLVVGWSALACNGILGISDPIDVESDAADASKPRSARDSSSTDDPDAGTNPREGGHCSAAKGMCDIVLQDCPTAPALQECVADNSGLTFCQPVQGTQQLPIGYACCPNGNGNPCAPGLSCVGSNCGDGGPATARCSPACCPGDDQHCGKSDPEGIAGACDLTLVDPSTSRELYQVCTYRKRCKPFQVEACKQGETCLVEDTLGTASCVTSAGKANRAPCTFGNECADGLICLGGADAGTCHYTCLLPGTVSPFDASVEKGPPGAGGCPAGEICNLQIMSLPPWYGACSLDGG